MIQLRPYHPALPLLSPLLPVVDVRRGSAHPLAWRGGDRDELRALWRRDRGAFAVDGALVLGCGETLPVLAGVFRALGWEVDEGQDREVGDG